MNSKHSKALTLDDLRRVEPGSFKVKPHYDPLSDSLTLFVAPDEARREPVDRYLAVYRSHRTTAVVGCHVTQVRRVLMKRISSMHLGLEDRCFTLSVLLHVLPLASEGVVAPRHYRAAIQPLLQVAQRVSVPALVGAD